MSRFGEEAAPERLRRFVWWPAVALTSAACCLDGKFLIGRRPYWRDAMRFFVPFKHYLVETIHHHEWPQWWPYDSGGTPLLAQPQFSTFHPSTLLYLILSFWHAYTGQELLATWLGLTGTYLLARALGQTRLAAVISALVFGSCGYFVSFYEHPFTKLSLGTMPWYLWALHRAQERGGAWRLAPAVAMGLLLLAGDAQVAMLAAGAGLALMVAGNRRRTGLVLAVLAPIGGVLLAAVQLLPALAIKSETARRGALAEANGWPLEWRDVLGLALPVDQGPSAYVRSTCIGVVAVMLIAASVVAPRRRVVAALWGIVGVSVWLALGDGFLLNALARKVLPFWGDFRYPIKSIAPGMLAWALLAGEGWRVLTDAQFRRTGRLVGAIVAGLLLALALTAVPEPGAWLVDWSACAIVLAAAVALLLAGSSRRRILAATLLGGQLILTGATLPMTVDASFYDAPPLVDVIRKAGVSLRGPYLERFDESESKYGGDDLPFILRSAVGGRGLPFGAIWHLPVLSYYNPAVSWRLTVILGRERLSFKTYELAFGLYGVGAAVITPDLLGDHPLEVLGTDPDSHYSVVRLPHSLPRAYAVHRALPVTGIDSFIDRLRRDDLKPGREVLLEGEIPDEAQHRPDELAVPVSIVSRDNSHVVMEADLPWPGYVVLNEAAYKGWSVTLDGAAAPSRVANGFVRALESPPGHHRIVWTYEAPGFLVGGWLSIICWLVIIGAALAMSRQTQRA